MTKSTSIDVSLFPLPNIVFFPTISLPLNVYEPRYLKMVEDSLESGQPIALALSNCIAAFGSTSTQKYLKICAKLVKNNWVCGMGSPQLLRENPDGSKVILLKGTGMVALQSSLSQECYVTCAAQIISTQTILKDENQFKLKRLIKHLTQWLKKEVLDPLYVEEMLAFLSSPYRIIEASAANLIEDCDLRQTILETVDINDRLDIILKILEADSETYLLDFLH